MFRMNILFACQDFFRCYNVLRCLIPDRFRKNTSLQVGIYAGKDFSLNLALEVKPRNKPLGICTSSGTVGHSFSYGKADAAVVISENIVLADAAATAVGNLIKQPDDIPGGIVFARGIEGIKGLLIITGDKMGLWGEVKICQTAEAV